MSVYNAINQANKVEFSDTKRREIIPECLTAASFRQIFVKENTTKRSKNIHAFALPIPPDNLVKMMESGLYQREGAVFTLKSSIAHFESELNLL